VVSLGGFASESIIGGEGGRSTGSVPPLQLSPPTVDIGDNASRMIHTLNDSKLSILIEIISMIITKLFDEENPSIFFRLGSDHTHARGIIRKNFVQDVQIHCFVVHETSMAADGAVWGVWWTVRGLSHPVQEVCQCLFIVCLSLKGPTMDSTGVLCLRGRRLAGLLALGDDLSDVGVVCHVDIIDTGGGDLWQLVDSASTGTRAADQLAILPAVRDSIAEPLHSALHHYTYRIPPSCNHSRDTSQF
jgi:hypothetical protein